MAILSILSHNLTPDQIRDLPPHVGDVVLLSDVAPQLAAQIRQCPSATTELHAMACDLITVLCSGEFDAHWAFDAMITPGGSPAFMAILSRELVRAGDAREEGMVLLFSDTARESVDEPQPDGSVRKVAVFKHRAWQSVRV